MSDALRSYWYRRERRPGCGIEGEVIRVLVKDIFFMQCVFSHLADGEQVFFYAAEPLLPNSLVWGETSIKFRGK